MYVLGTKMDFSNPCMESGENTTATLQTEQQVLSISGRDKVWQKLPLCKQVVLNFLNF